MEKDFKLLYDFNSCTKILPLMYWKFAGFHSDLHWTSFDKQYLGRWIPNFCMAVVNGFSFSRDQTIL